MDQLVVLKSKEICQFCKTKTNDCLTLGPKYKLGNIVAHYYCVLLSNKAVQRGRDNEGLLGFLKKDIEKELQRSSVLVCYYCRRQNATIHCATRKCKKLFHLPCGLRNGSLHQFINNFKSYCKNHRPIQEIPSNIVREAQKRKTICCICFDPVSIRDRDTLWAPCCEKTWYHRNCVQKLAHSAGYFFKCAICNDVHKFKNWMQKFGIFIPQQDASWELEPNAFEELLFRYDRCDAKPCKCPQGEKKNEENTMWEIILCESCGSQGIHIACGNLKFHEPEWECSDCKTVTENIKTDPKELIKIGKPGEEASMVLKLSEMSQKKRRRSSDELENYVLDKRKRIRLSLVEEEEAEDDTEIDVETVEVEIVKDSKTVDIVIEDDVDDIPVDIVSADEWSNTEDGSKANIEDVLTSVKPGPLSYKLSVIQEVLKESSLPHRETNPTIPEVVELVDLTDETKAGGDIEIVEEIIKRPPRPCKSVARLREIENFGFENHGEDPLRTKRLRSRGVVAILAENWENPCVSTTSDEKLVKEMGCQVTRKGEGLVQFFNLRLVKPVKRFGLFQYFGFRYFSLQWIKRVFALWSRFRKKRLKPR